VVQIRIIRAGSDHPGVRTLRRFVQPPCGLTASLALDAADNLYFTDAFTSTTYGCFTLRMVNVGTGILNSIAGHNFTLPYPGTCVEFGPGYQWEPTCGGGLDVGTHFAFCPAPRSG
jgi:hypothetical protein